MFDFCNAYCIGKRIEIKMLLKLLMFFHKITAMLAFRFQNKTRTGKKSNDHSSFNSKCEQGLFAFQQKLLVIFNGLSPVLLSD